MSVSFFSSPDRPLQMTDPNTAEDVHSMAMEIVPKLCGWYFGLHAQSSIALLDVVHVESAVIWEKVERSGL